MDGSSVYQGLKCGFSKISSLRCALSAKETCLARYQECQTNGDSCDQTLDGVELCGCWTLRFKPDIFQDVGT
jgi:hypothetical protein